MKPEELRAALADARARRERIRKEQQEIHERAGGDGLDPGQAERWANLTTGLENVDAEISRLDDEWREVLERRAQVAQIGQNPAAQEAGSSIGTGAPVVGGSGRDAALRTIERFSNSLSNAAGDRLVSLVERDRSGLDARYLDAIGQPAYDTAFEKILRFGPSMAALRFTPEESEAVRLVTHAEEMRAMSVGVPAEGGFAVPFDLDPTIILTSDGSINPIRSLARQITIATSEWRGVSSAGVTADYVPEGTEAGDDSPTLAQPTIKPERGQLFTPFSIELGMDWGGLRGELARLFADARDNLDAERFVSGTGIDEPEGLISGLDVGSHIDTATASTFAVDDCYTLQEALPPRFQPRGSFLSSNVVGNRIYRFIGSGDPDEPRLMSEDRTRILGKPYREVSTMSTTLNDGDAILLYGDLFEAYTIVDRIGLSVELIAHLFGPNRRPTGERGLYGFFRTGAGVVVDNAARLLVIQAT